MGQYAPSFADSVVREVQGSLNESFSADGIDCSVQLYCPYDQRHDVLAEILGGRLYWPHGNFTKQPFAVSGSAIPFDAKSGQDEQCLTYDLAVLTINYERKKVDPEQLVSESLEPTCEFITLNPAGFLWADATGDPLTEDEAPGRLVRGLNITRTVYNWEPPLPGGLLTNVGKVNTAAYTSAMLGLTFAAETLLFVPPVLDRTVMSDGEGAFNVNLKFSYKPEGWNKFWRAKTGSYEEIYSAELADVYKNYPLGDFAAFLY